MKRSTRFLCYLTFSLIIFLVSALGLASAATESLLYSFEPHHNGSYPQGGMVRDAVGNFYGVTRGGGDYSNGTVFELQPNSNGGWTENVIYSFKGGADGSAPNSVILDSVGNLYGTTNLGGILCGGGIDACGTAFELTSSPTGSWTKTLLYEFGQYPGDGTRPAAGLVLDKEGNLYGTTTLGGIGRIDGNGTVFELTPLGGGKWSETLLHKFDPNTRDGSSPQSSLIMDQAGNLYGTTSAGGNGCSSGCGTIFELSPEAGGQWTETILYSFRGSIDGGGPFGAVIFDAAGNLYGTADEGGTGTGQNCLAGCGVVFELIHGSGSQWSESVLYDFEGGSDGLNPKGNLVFDTAGNLYGTTVDGGDVGQCYLGGCGVAFELSPSDANQWNETVLWRFGTGNSGNASSGLILDSAGAIYGMTNTDHILAAGVNGTVFKLFQKSGQWHATNIVDFQTDDARNPMTGLVSDSAGNLYGASAGGTHDLGTIFELSPGADAQWTNKLLYSFLRGNGSSTDNQYGVCSRLILDSAGNLYGEKTSGGTNGYGTVFELSPSASGGWSEKDLYTFSGGAGGAYPIGGLVFDNAGNLYGSTRGQGAGHGVVFELTRGSDGSWAETVIHTFGGYPVDGSQPAGGLIFDEGGNLYGTTYAGGSSVNCGFREAGCGVVFELSHASGNWIETVVHSFTGSGNDGRTPNVGLILDLEGNLYGTTQKGGNACADSSGCGIVFELSPAVGGWSESVLYAFTDGLDGGYPDSGLTRDASGNLFGTTTGPGEDACSSYSCGAVFKVSPNGSGTWTETVLHKFTTAVPDGFEPAGGLVFGGNGVLYGATEGGGIANEGAVFELVP